MSRVLTIGDTHCPGMLDSYVPFLQRVRDKYKCNRVVHIGDLVDWNSISYHEKNPGLPSPQQERDDAQKQVDRLAKAFPKVDWLIGNHDELPARKCVSAMIPPDMLKDYREQWSLPKTWRVHERFAKLEIDGNLYCHGDAGAGGKYPHINQAAANFQSTILGHFHSVAGVEWMANERMCVFGMSVGCGIDHHLEQFKYGKRYARKPVVSCGVVIDGDPIVVRMPLEKRRKR